MDSRGMLDCTFQPTPPSREATRIAWMAEPCNMISTHTSLAGGDNFAFAVSIARVKISTHTSLAGGDF